MKSVEEAKVKQHQEADGLTLMWLNGQCLPVNQARWKQRMQLRHHLHRNPQQVPLLRWCSDV